MLPSTLKYTYFKRLFLMVAEEEILLRWVLILLVSWNDPLYHLVTKLQDMKWASNALPSNAKEIEEDNKVLQEGMETITGKVSSLLKVSLLFSWMEEVTSVMRNVLWDFSLCKNKIQVFCILDCYYRKQKPSHS